MDGTRPARRPSSREGVQPIAADLPNANATAAALRDVDPGAVFITTSLRRDSEAENIRVNATTVRNLVDGPPEPAPPRHVALFTGLMRYPGLYEAYGRGTLPQTPFRKDQAGLTSRTSTTRRRTRRSPLRRATAYMERPPPG